jgi:hypothetical protein
MSSEENKFDPMSPIEDAEVSEFAKNLSADDKIELRRQALQMRAVQQAAKEPPNFGRMSDVELAEFCRKNYGF